MRKKVEKISKDLAERLSKWDCVDSITLSESVERDIIDPYFFLSLDVFFNNEIPSLEYRRSIFSDAGAFESSSVAKKDRFLIEDIPVRIEYKGIDRITNVLDNSSENLWVFRQTGTYMFYRIEKGTVLFQKTSWIDEIKQKLNTIPEVFWNAMALSGSSTMEHYLIDLNTAAMMEDTLFFLISSAGFIKSFTSLLYVLNRKFEPSGRLLYNKLKELKVLPEGFKGRFESFVNEDPEFPPSRKREVAELLARSIIVMI